MMMMIPMATNCVMFCGQGKISTSHFRFFVRVVPGSNRSQLPKSRPVSDVFGPCWKIEYHNFTRTSSHMVCEILWCHQTSTNADLVDTSLEYDRCVPKKKSTNFSNTKPSKLPTQSVGMDSPTRDTSAVGPELSRVITQRYKSKTNVMFWTFKSPWKHLSFPNSQSQLSIAPIVKCCSQLLQTKPYSEKTVKLWGPGWFGIHNSTSRTWSK